MAKRGPKNAKLYVVKRFGISHVTKFQTNRNFRSILFSGPDGPRFLASGVRIPSNAYTLCVRGAAAAGGDFFPGASPSSTRPKGPSQDFPGPKAHLLLLSYSP